MPPLYRYVTIQNRARWTGLPEMRKIQQVRRIDTSTDVQKAWLQWCLQEAIKARGLHLLQSQDINDGRYYTDISRVGPGYEGDMHVERTLHLVAEEDGDSPVAALLTACIATLEAQR